MNIFVAKLNYKTSVDQVNDLFANYGNVTNCKIIMDRETGRSKGYGFVEMDSDEEANVAIEELNDYEFDGQTIVVKESKPRDGGGGGGGFKKPKDNGGYNNRY
ncbi:MAG: RNA recognition motif-containing protein [Saprospiraceae bacterium]|jgi:RNA recognition motif-containing protein